jgi:sRNA-binding carbon storage regulator CsrA
MLVLSRKSGEGIVVRNELTGEIILRFKLIALRSGQARIGIDADRKRFRIDRQEVDARRTPGPGGVREMRSPANNS